MATLMVVIVNVARECSAATGGGSIALCVGPLGDQRSDHPLRFAVRLGAPGSGPVVPKAEPRALGGEVGADVPAAVVGEQGADAHPELSKPGHGAQEKRGAVGGGVRGQ